MSQKSLRVTVEPLSKVQEEKMENPTKEVSKKRSAKDDKKAAAAAKDTPSESTSTATNGVAPPAKEAEPQQEITVVAVNGKSNKKDKKDKKEPNKNADKTTPVTNGVSDVALNAAAEPAATAVAVVAPTTAELNPDIIEDDAMVQTTEQDNDELFPELNYDETSDNECQFDTASPNFSPVGRSATRRSQAKKIPTPETPQLPTVKSDTPESGVCPSPSRGTPDTATPLREKIFKMQEAYTPISVSPAPAQERLGQDSETEEDPKGRATPTEEAGSTKTDTNFSKSRIKVSPYRRSSRISEQYSIMANYSGNNSTQQTDVVGDISSSSREPSENGEQSGDCSSGERSFSDSFKSIKGRRSYRHLREISLRNLSAQRLHHHRPEEDNTESKDVSISSVNATNGGSTCDTVSSESSAKWTPVGHVVGRKRRNESSEREEHPLPPHTPSPALLLGDVAPPGEALLVGDRPSKRQRLLGYVSTPLRQLREKMTSSTPIQFSSSSRIPSTHKADPMLAPSAEETITTDEPMVADIVPLAKEGGPEHKWCSIM